MSHAVKRKLGYDDLADMPDDGLTREIFDGELVVTPSPAPIHQRVSRRLQRQLEASLRIAWARRGFQRAARHNPGPPRCSRTRSARRHESRDGIPPSHRRPSSAGGRDLLAIDGGSRPKRENPALRCGWCSTLLAGGYREPPDRVPAARAGGLRDGARRARK